MRKISVALALLALVATPRLEEVRAKIGSQVLSTIEPFAIIETECAMMVS